MKRLMVLLVVTLMVTLTGCGPSIAITPDKIDVVFDNPRYEGTSIIVDVWITNGTEYDEEIDVVDFWFELPEDTDWSAYSTNEVCGAQFDIYEIVKSDGYNEYEIEFTSDFIYLSQDDLTTLGVTLDDLEFYYFMDYSAS